MRHIFLTAAFVLIGGSAMASSILPIEGMSTDHGGSIISKSCSDCPALKGKAMTKTYTVPDLKPGTETTVVRDINGEKKIVRTEAWMGGSPVVFISKPTPEALEAAGISSDGIDPTAKTASVTPAAPVAVAAQPAPLDTSGFELRLQ